MSNLAPATAAMLIAAALSGYLIRSQLLAAGVDAHRLRSLVGLSKASWQSRVEGSSLRIFAVCMWVLLILGLVSLPLAVVETWRQLVSVFHL